MQYYLHVMIEHGLMILVVLLDRVIILLVDSLTDVPVQDDVLIHSLELIVIRIKLIYRIRVVHLLYRHIVGIDHILLSQVDIHLVARLRHVGHQHVEL